MIARYAPAGLRPRELAAFSLVGLAATAVHFAVVNALVPLGLAPLVANVVAFLTAFGVSFAGHERWSFPAPGRERARALRRFFVVAGAAFCLNEGAYWWLLDHTALSYRIALLLVLGGVALCTLLAAKLWAFRDG